MSISRLEFVNILRDVTSEEFSHIPDDEDAILHTFSRKFNKKMEKLIKSQRKVYWGLVNTTAKRVAVIFAILLLLLTSACSIKDIREPVVDFFVGIYENFIHYTFTGNTTQTIEKEYCLAYVPDGFVEVDKVESDTIIRIMYKNEQGDFIEFTQATTEEFGIILSSKNEKSYIKMVNGMEINVCEFAATKVSFWIYDGYYFNIRCSGEVDIKTIFNIIEGIK